MCELYPNAMFVILHMCVCVSQSHNRIVELIVNKNKSWFDQKKKKKTVPLSTFPSLLLTQQLRSHTAIPSSPRIGH